MKSSFLLFTALLLQLHWSTECATNFIAFTFGTDQGDSLSRQIRSAQLNNVDLKLIPDHSTVTKFNRLSLMKDYIESMRNDNETIVLFVERGGMFLNSSEEIQSRFRAANARVVLSADHNCLPDPSLKDSYPPVGNNEKRFVDIDGLIGYADTLYQVLSEPSLQTIEHIQYYFTQLFLNPDFREKFQLKLDSKSEIFQNMDQSFGEHIKCNANLTSDLDQVSIHHSESRQGSLVNFLTGSFPAIVQPGSSKTSFNTLSNYFGKAWDPVKGCQQCNRSSSDLSEYPKVTLAIFIDQATPFITEFFNRISHLSYPKSRLNLRISNMVPSHEAIVTAFIDSSASAYNSFVYLASTDIKSSKDRKSATINECAAYNCDFLLVVDSVVQLTNENIIQTLISYNKPIIAPLLSRREKLWSNFWGALGADKYYARSFDYLDIINSEKRGIWNVPHIHSMYLIEQKIIPKLHDIYIPHPDYKDFENDMIFSGNLRDKDQFMFVVNEEEYGYLVDPETTSTEHLHNDLWEIFANPLDWEEKYIHKNYSMAANSNTTLKDIAQPCPDVFWWPFLSETFAKHLVEEMEHYGQWSNGKNEDTRLEGGYENVPTRDIHMRQVDWEGHWMEVLKKYVYPMQIKLFQGYYDEPRARMNFVVRYKPSEQDRLRPHHDASSYTLNIALNKPGVDYEGGGAKFNRYNCSVTDSKIGWVLMSPGKITHLHEGLPTTKGTRYIFVTFINP